MTNGISLQIQRSKNHNNDKRKFFNMMFECLWTCHGWAEKKTIGIFVYSLVLLKEVVLTLECSTLSI